MNLIFISALNGSYLPRGIKNKSTCNTLGMDALMSHTLVWMPSSITHFLKGLLYKRLSTLFGNTVRKKGSSDYSCKHQKCGHRGQCNAYFINRNIGVLSGRLLLLEGVNKTFIIWVELSSVILRDHFVVVMHIMSLTFGHKVTSGKKVQFNRVSNCVSKLAYDSHVLVNNTIWTQTADGRHCLPHRQSLTAFSELSRGRKMGLVEAYKSWRPVLYVEMRKPKAVKPVCPKQLTQMSYLVGICQACIFYGWLRLLVQLAG